MEPRSPTFSRGKRLAWEASTEDLAPLAAAAAVVPAPLLPSAPSPVAAAGRPNASLFANAASPSGAVDADAQPGPVSRRHSPVLHRRRHLPHPPHSPPVASSNFERPGSAPLAIPLAVCRRHDLAAFNRRVSQDEDVVGGGGGGSGDGSVVGEGGGGGRLLLRGGRLSRVSIFLRRGPLADPRNQHQTHSGGTRAATRATAPAASSAADAAAAAPAAGALALAAGGTGSQSRGGLRAEATASAAVPSTLPYAAARPRLCSSDGTASDPDSDGDRAELAAEASTPETMPPRRCRRRSGGPAIAAAAAAAAAGRTGSSEPASRTDEEIIPMLPTPPLSLNTSYAGSFASSASSSCSGGLARISPDGVLDSVAPATRGSGCLQEVPVTAAATASMGSSCSVATAGSGEAEGGGSGSGARAVCSAATGIRTSRSCSSSSCCNNGGCGSGSKSSGARDTWPSDPAVCSSSRSKNVNGGGDGCTRSNGQVTRALTGAAAVAASLPAALPLAPTGSPTGPDCSSPTGPACSDGASVGPSAGHRRVPLSISFLSVPSSTDVGASFGSASAAEVEMPPLTAPRASPSGCRTRRALSAAHAGQAAKAAAAAAAVTAPSVIAADVPVIAARSLRRISPHSPSAAPGYAAACTSRVLAAATAAASAVAAAALSPTEGVAAATATPTTRILAANEGDLEGIDVVASIRIAGPADEVETPLRGGGGGAAAAIAVADANATVPVAAVATAAAAAGGDGGEDGGAAGELPPEVRRRLSGHLGRQKAKSIRCWKDLSLSMAGQPPGHWLVGTMLLLVMMVGLFLFMAGQYEFVRPIDLSGGSAQPQPQQQSLSSTLQSDPLSAYSWGPSSLRAWLAFWRSPASRTFTFDYLRLWGGRYGPDLAAGQWWRWATSLLLHQSSMHLTANTALFLVLSAYLESLFGFWRVLPVWVVAGVAGNMVSACFENACMLVVGSSGAVFGLLGAYVADAALNFESIPLLWLRLAGMAAVAALLVALQVTGSTGGNGGHGSSTSHASHIGGFLAGGLLALVLVPDFKAKRSKKVTELLRKLDAGAHLPDTSSPGGRQLYSFWQRHCGIQYCMYGVVVLLLLVMLVGLPLTLYLRTFHRMVCG